MSYFPAVASGPFSPQSDLVSVVAVDIEGLYLGRFAQRRKDLAVGVLFVVSDQTLGKITINETNAQRGLIDDSADKLVSFLVPKALHA